MLILFGGFTLAQHGRSFQTSPAPEITFFYDALNFFSDENDNVYKDDVYKEEHKDYYIRKIHEDIVYGKMTAKMLIDRIEGGHQLPIKMELPYYLVKRETCAPCRKP